MENRLRICIISFQFFPVIGGAEARAKKQASRLRELGHDVMILTLRHEKAWPAEEVIDGIPVVRIGGLYNRRGILRIGRLGHFPIDVLTLIKLWRLRHRYDLLHSLQISTLGGMAALVCKLTGKPLVVSIPSTGPGKQQTLADATLLADTLVDKMSDTSFLTVPYHDILVGDFTNLNRTAFGGNLVVHYLKKSEAFYHILSSRSYHYLTSNGFRADKIVRIPNGIEPDKFHPDYALRPDPAKPARDILCVARLSFPKGVDVLLHAWYRMMREPDAWRSHLQPRLLIAGPGELEDHMRRIAHELGIEESVVFLGAVSNVIPLLQSAWGFVLPSRWEGMPNALLEAMACAVPCIATRVSGSEDIIENGVNGLMVEPEQPAALANALRTLIEDTALAQKLAQKGYETIQRDYLLSHVVDQMIDLYRKALGEEQPAMSKVLVGAEEK